MEQFQFVWTFPGRKISVILSRTKEAAHPTIYGSFARDFPRKSFDLG